MDFCTLGMLILDEIHHAPPKAPSYNILGGAGTFAALGARLFRTPPASARIAWVIHRGSDFPAEIQREIECWKTGACWVATPERLTTRGLNEYVGDRDAEFRAFRYTSTKIRIDETHLTDDMLLSKSFHMVCSPDRCIKLVKGIKEKRQLLNCIEEAIFVWEPVPDLCNADALDAVRIAARCVDIVSPNLSELAALFTQDETMDEETENMDKRCLTILQGEFGKKGGAVVVRCGSQGCYLRSSTERKTLPAFWTGAESQQKVVDPTGGGNQFLGALCIGLQSEEPVDFSRLEKGAIFGNIAASFVVEQVGVPKLTSGPSGAELWNGDSVADRMSRYVDRLRLDHKQT